MPNDNPQFISDIGQTFRNNDGELFGVRFVYNKTNEMLFVQECKLVTRTEGQTDEEFNSEAEEFEEDGWQEEPQNWGEPSKDAIDKAKELIKTGDYKPEATMPAWSIPQVQQTFATAVFEVVMPDGRVFYIKTERDCRMEDIDEVVSIAMEKPNRREVPRNSEEWNEIIKVYAGV